MLLAIECAAEIDVATRRFYDAARALCRQSPRRNSNNLLLRSYRRQPPRRIGVSESLGIGRCTSPNMQRRRVRVRERERERDIKRAIKSC